MSLRESPRPRPCRIDRAIANSIWQGRVLTERSRLKRCGLYGLFCLFKPVTQAARGYYGGIMASELANQWVR